MHARSQAYPAWMTRQEEDDFNVSTKRIIVFGLIAVLMGMLAVNMGWSTPVPICAGSEFAAMSTNTLQDNWTKLDSNRIAYFSEIDPVLIQAPRGGSIVGFNYVTKKPFRITEGSVPSANFVITCS